MSDDDAAYRDEDGEMRKPKWLQLMTGELFDPHASTAAPPISVGQWLSRYRAIHEAVFAATHHLAHQREQLALLEELAHSRRDLRRALQEEIARQAPTPVFARPVEALVRCRAVGQFSVEYFRLPFSGNPGDVQDLPLGLVERLGACLERVDPTTPLRIVQPVVGPR